MTEIWTVGKEIGGEGPDKLGAKLEIISAGETGHLVADVHWVGSIDASVVKYCRTTRDARARLIAAAPELLASLNTLVRQACQLNSLVAQDESRYDAWIHESDALEAACNQASRAIAKTQPAAPK